MLDVAAIPKRQNCDRLIVWVDNPIFWNLCLSVISTLGHGITLWVVRADDLEHQVGTVPKAFPLPRVLSIA